MGETVGKYREKGEGKIARREKQLELERKMGETMGEYREIYIRRSENQQENKGTRKKAICKEG